MRSYPISTFLLWDVPPDARDGVEVYRFLDAVSESGKHNERVRAFNIPKLTFVLDGQQRFTSIRVGLEGTYEAKRKYVRKGESPFVVQRMFLDLLRNGSEPDSNGEVAYGFQFRENRYDRDAYWFEVGRILDGRAGIDELVRSTLDAVKGTRGANRQQLETVEHNLRRLHAAVYGDQSICYHTEQHSDPERMLDIFVRANSGGRPLSKADLLLSNLTVHWRHLNAREEIKHFVDDLNEKLNKGVDRPKKTIQQDFVLKSCLVLLDLEIAYRITSFNTDTCSQIAESWSDIKTAIADCIEAANYFGVNGASLTSANALVPVVYYLYRNPRTRITGESKDDAHNAQLARRWLILALLNGVFSGSSDSMLHRMRDALKKHGEHGRPFPVRELDEAAKEGRRIASSDPTAIDSILKLRHGDPACFLALTLLFDEQGWGRMDKHEDHIFPRDLFKQDLRSYREDRDVLGNLTLLLARENEEKNKMPFDQWIQTREPAFRQRHLIPDDPQLWRVQAYPEFLEQRTRLVRERLQTVLRVAPLPT